MAGLKYNQETTLPETMSHGSGWHGPLDDHVPLQTRGVSLPSMIVSGIFTEGA